VNQIEIKISSRPNTELARSSYEMRQNTEMRQTDRRQMASRYAHGLAC